MTMTNTKPVAIHLAKPFFQYALLAILAFSISPYVKAETLNVAIHYIGLETQTTYAGAQQGLDEANLQGQFLGQQYQLSQSVISDTVPDNASAVIADVENTEALVSLAKKYPNLAIFNVSVEDDALRSICLPNVFSVIPSQKMKADAVAQWLEKNPKANAKAQAWHPAFVKYAARQLNKRYSKKFDRKMDDPAWAGWAAMKMLTDTVARIQSENSEAIIKFLKSDLAFDGQKGVEMNFRTTGQLRQILLLVENGDIVGEAPVRGVSSDLDSLGTISCNK